MLNRKLFCMTGKVKNSVMTHYSHIPPLSSGKQQQEKRDKTAHVTIFCHPICGLPHSRHLSQRPWPLQLGGILVPLSMGGTIRSIAGGRASKAMRGQKHWQCQWHWSQDILCKHDEWQYCCCGHPKSTARWTAANCCHLLAVIWGHWCMGGAAAVTKGREHKANASKA